MFTMNNKKQPPEVFYKKAVLKNFSILIGKYLCSGLFNQVAALEISNFFKKRFQRRCFSLNIAKFLKKLVLKKIFERLLLNNVKGNYSSMKFIVHCKIGVHCSLFIVKELFIVKQVLKVSQHLQENTFTGVSFLINIVVTYNLSLSLF